MKWYIGLILGVSLAFGASVCRGEWLLRIHQGATVEDRVLADIDSLTILDAPDGMIWISRGTVRLGQAGVPGAELENDCWVEGFWIDRYEVSNAKYKAFIDAGGYTTQAYWNPVGWAWRVAQGITLPAGWNSPYIHGGGTPEFAQFPVIGVSWWEADAYCRWAGGRLPTEAEWEKAAKGGCETHGMREACEASDTPTYPWGEGLDGARANYWLSGDPYDGDNDGDGNTTPVGYYNGYYYGGYQTIDSPSPYGLYDMAGNATEWCSSAWADYPYDAGDGRENPPATSDDLRILRGGCWMYGDGDIRSAYRFINGASGRQWIFGFRCARSE